MYSWFQNFEYRFEDVVFICLDWNTRTQAITRGVYGYADIFNFTGGTLQWLRSRLKLIHEQPRKPKTIIFVQHHSFDTFIIPPWWIGFIEEKKVAIRKVLSEFLPPSTYWGVFSGHIHRWFDGIAFNKVPGWENFKQWETNAAKETPSVTLVTFKDSKIVKVEKLLE